MNGAALLVATFGYVGFFPIAPGTAGSLAALALYAVVQSIGVPAFEGVTLVAIFAAGVWSSTVSERLLGGIDPGPVVIDEVLGMLVTLAWLPLSLAGVLAGFLLFRVLDVIKPFPAKRLEDAPGGWGIMLDDVIAGLYGQLALRALAWGAPWLVLA
jgi:phosphatidylglycerophosphatase A